MRTSVRAALAIGLTGIVLTLAACGDVAYGVEVYNDTDEVIRAEMLTVNAQGESAPYSSAIVNRGAVFENRMAGPVRDQAMRVRFTLADNPRDDPNWIMLSIPQDKSRTYSLRLEGGRLRAQEFTRSKPHE